MTLLLHKNVINALSPNLKLFFLNTDQLISLKRSFDNDNENKFLPKLKKLFYKMLL